MKFRIYIIIISLFLVACGSKKNVVTKKKNNRPKTEKVVPKKESPVGIISKEDVSKPSADIPKPRTSVDDYIDAFSEIAKSQMRTFKIPASITLAQGILESGSGNGRLAVEANNHFGIKCHGWTGAKIYHDDDASQECFRKYEAPESSYKDHSEFLTGRQRYSELFLLEPNDYKGWAKGLKAAGYATDRNYPDKLISLIERFQLYKFDEEVLGRAFAQTPIIEDTQLNHIVAKGDTLYALSKRYSVTIDTLKTLNNLKSNDLSIGQVLVIKSK